MKKQNNSFQTDMAQVQFVHLEFVDIEGSAKSVTIPFQELEATQRDGRWFDGGSIGGFARASEQDMYLEPDMNTFLVYPWEPQRAKVICDVALPDGAPFEGSPRGQLKKSAAFAETLGYTFQTAPEIEFFLLHGSDLHINQLQPIDKSSYFDAFGEASSAFWRDLMDAFAALHIPIESCHHEAASGQFEVDLALQDALSSADAVMTAKQTIKVLAQRYGARATFMPKPFSGVNGSGMHVHQRLAKRDGGANAFAQDHGADGAEYGLSDIGMQFIAGQIAHAQGMSAVLAPLVNSYKRFVPNHEAPVEINWGHHNQEAMIRVPKVHSQRINDVRIEIRSPDSSCNPYLAYCALLRAGLDGVIRKLDPPPPRAVGAPKAAASSRMEYYRYILPQSLSEALTALERDDLMTEALGPLILNEFLDAKWREWNAYRMEVSQWELQRYLDQ